jgi:hypothetical protein
MADEIWSPTILYSTCFGFMEFNESDSVSTTLPSASSVFMSTVGMPLRFRPVPAGHQTRTPRSRTACAAYGPGCAPGNRAARGLHVTLLGDCR